MINLPGKSYLTWADAAFLEIIEHPCVPVVGELGDLVHPDNRASFDDTLQSAAQIHAATVWQGRMHTESAIKSVRISLTPPDTDDPEQPWTGVLQDLSDVMDLQSRFESVLDAAQAYTWRRDMRSGQSQFGIRWAQFAKHEDGRTSMSSDDWLARLHPDDVPAVRAAVQALERGDLDHHTLLHRRKLEDGNWVWLRVHAGVSERDGEGIPTALSGVSFDITSEIEQQQRSDLLNQELRNELSDTQ